MTLEVEGTAEMGRAQRKQESILLCARPVSAVPLLRFWGPAELLQQRQPGADDPQTFSEPLGTFLPPQGTSP